MNNTATRTDLHLPPGLWLPTAEESTEQYREGEFDHGEHEYERVVDYGMFVVALACFDDKRRKSGSLMPTERDIRELKREGYGISRYHIDNHYGGYARLQTSLGYFPRDHRPPLEILLKRLNWIANEAIPQAAEFEGSRSNLDDLLQWGKRRRLLPSRKIINEALDGDKELLRSIFLLSQPSAMSDYSILDAYKMAARVIREQGGPVTQQEFNGIAQSDYDVKPYQVIANTCGSLSSLWHDFGYITDSSGMTRDNLLEHGVRHYIRCDGEELTKPLIESLSKSKKFPSTFPIARAFDGSVKEYRKEVEGLYQKFTLVKLELQNLGVSDEVIKLASRDYVVGEDFERRLLDNHETLRILSGEDDSARYILGLIKSGFDLEFDYIAKMQLEDLRKHMMALGVANKAVRNFIFTLIPRSKVIDFLK